MKKLLRFTISILLLFPLSTSAQKGLGDRLETYMDTQAEINGFSGSVLVSRNDSVLLRKAYGFAVEEWKLPNTIESRYSLASVSKQFTAVSILQLEEKGKLSLEDKLSQYFPDFPKATKINLQMLLSHNSGLAMDFDELYLSQTQLDEDSVLSFIKKKALLFEPNTNTAYSNIGYFLLARIIEKVSGLSYDEYLQTFLFNPVGMQHSGTIKNGVLIEQFASNYYMEAGVFRKNPYINWEFNIGHDGLYSTVDDLYKWSESLLEDTLLLSAASKQKMFQAYNEQDFGLGVLVNPFYGHQHALIAHDGGFFGAMTSFNVFPEDHLTVIVLSNNQSPAYLLAYALSAIVFGKEVLLPHKQLAQQENQLIYSIVAGEYEGIKILHKKGKLYYNTLDTELLPEAEVSFFCKDDPYRSLEFVLDERGKAKGMYLIKAGVKEWKARKK